MAMFTGFRILSSGMSAQRTRLNVTSSNLANAQTTRSEEGGAYRRKDPIFAATPLDGIDGDDPASGELVSVEVVDLAPDETPLPLVFAPGHPDAGGAIPGSVWALPVSAAAAAAAPAR